MATLKRDPSTSLACHVRSGFKVPGSGSIRSSFVPVPFPIIFLFPSRVNSSSTVLVHQPEPSSSTAFSPEPFFLRFSLSLRLRFLGRRGHRSLSLFYSLVNEHNSTPMQFRRRRNEDEREEKRDRRKTGPAPIESYREARRLHLPSFRISAI